jgi:hypothetical protein
MSPESIAKGNPITYEQLVYDKYIAQVELKVLRKVFAENPIGKINFDEVGIVILLVTTKDDKTVITGKDLPKYTLKENDIVQVFGSVKDIEKVFSMRI